MASFNVMKFSRLMLDRYPIVAFSSAMFAVPMVAKLTEDLWRQPRNLAAESTRRFKGEIQYEWTLAGYGRAVVARDDDDDE